MICYISVELIDSYSIDGNSNLSPTGRYRAYFTVQTTSLAYTRDTDAVDTETGKLPLGKIIIFIATNKQSTPAVVFDVHYVTTPAALVIAWWFFRCTVVQQ